MQSGPSVNNDQNKPIVSWAKIVEEGAMVQAENLANLPFLYKWVALMPDVHQGYGMPIGGVIATEGVVIPNAVGVDIGCGVAAVKLNLLANAFSSKMLRKLVDDIKKVVPTGFKHHETMERLEWMPQKPKGDSLMICEKEFNSARRQVGTLGGGNHFIEIQKGEDGYMWVMVHSGSRNLGYKVAKFYNKIAIRRNKRWYSTIPSKWELAFLPLKEEFGKMYMKEMEYCVKFAKSNRKHIVTKVLEQIDEQTPCMPMEAVDIAHNYAAMEHHYKKNVMIHRKGAVKVTKNSVAIIPGSMGTNSYIVKGVRTERSFNSCSHGAGRIMGRKQAKRFLKLNYEQRRLLDVVHDLTHVDKLDEAPSAYKDIDIVMKNQEDLVEITEKLTPIASVKG